MSGQNKASIVSNLVSTSTRGQNTSLSVFTHRNPEIASALSLLVTPQNPVRFDRKGNRSIEKPNIADLRRITSETSEVGDNAEAAINLFTDVKIAADILVASIRSPNDGFNGELNYELKSNLNIMPLSGKLLPFVRSYMEDVYPLNDKIDKILRECLFGTGSYPIFILPENSLSDIVNGKAQISAEALKSQIDDIGSKGYLGKTSSEAVQSFAAESGGLLNRSAIKSDRQPNRLNVPSLDGKGFIATELVTFHDNPLLLQDKISRDIVNQIQLRKMAREGMQTGDEISDRQMASLVYRNTTGRRGDFLKIKTDGEITRYSVSRPLVMDLPPESVIPIIHRGKPDEPLGYIVVLDDDNMPVSRNYNRDEFEAMRASLAADKAGLGTSNMASYMLQRTANIFGGDCSKITSQQLNEMAAQLVEADFAAKWRNGAFGTSEASISDIKRLSEMMLYRVFKNQKTKLLFVPVNYITYFNYQVDMNGIGENLLQSGLNLFALRAKVMYARALGAIKNSIGRKSVSIQIDEDEIDPYEVFEVTKAEILRANRIGVSTGSLSPMELSDQVQAAGYEFNIESGDNMPKTKITHQEVSSSYNRPDNELADELASMTINMTGVPPEMVEEGKRVEFEGIAARNNILLSKRVYDMQIPFDRGFTHLTVNMLMADPKFVKEIKKVIGENLELITKGSRSDELEELIEEPQELVTFLAMEFISGIRAFLSKPDIKSIESQMEALKIKEEEVEAALGYIFSSEANVAAFIGAELHGKLDDLKAAAKSAVMRKYMQENGLGLEVFELVNSDADGVLSWDLSREIESHAGALAKVVEGMLRRGSTVAKATDTALAAIDSPEGDGSFDSGSDGGSSFGDDSGGDDLGGDDFGGSSEGSGDEGGGDDFLDGIPGI